MYICLDTRGNTMRMSKMGLKMEKVGVCVTSGRWRCLGAILGGGANMCMGLTVLIWLFLGLIDYTPGEPIKIGI